MDSNLPKKLPDDSNLEDSIIDLESSFENLNKHLDETLSKPEVIGLSKFAEQETKTPEADEKPTTSSADKKPNTNPWSFEKLDGFYIPTANVAKMPLEKQEKYLIRDLIYAFTGIPSSFIEPETPYKTMEQLNMLDVSKLRFKICTTFSSALRALAQQLLPLISYYLVVQNFVEEMALNVNKGQVYKAFSSKLNDHLTKYYELQSQLETELENNQLTLQKLVYFLRPTVEYMNMFAMIVEHIRTEPLNSAQIINFIEEQYNNVLGNKETAKYMQELVEATAAPYMKMVEIWTTNGVIFDPKHEFFIEKRERKRKNCGDGIDSQLDQYSIDYWETLFRIHEERVPRFLKKHTQIILNTGKYLNVLRHCDIQMSLDKTLVYTPSKPEEVQHLLSQNYESTVKRISELLINQHNLMSHLKSVKLFLLMQAGDFIGLLMEECENELLKNVDLVVSHKLEDCLSICLNQSTTHVDPNMENVHIDVLDVDLPTQIRKVFGNDNLNTDTGVSVPHISCFEAFALRYEIGLPISIILTRSSMQSLQMVFRELFFIKYVLQQLAKSWCLIKKIKVEVMQVCVVRQTMYTTMLNLEHYLMIDVIETNWQKFMKLSEKTDNIDILQANFKDFVDCTLKFSMLTLSTTITRSIFTLGHTCLNYCTFIENLCAEGHIKIDKSAVQDYKTEFNEMLTAIIKTIQEILLRDPSEYLRDLLDRLKCTNTNLPLPKMSSGTPDASH